MDITKAHGKLIGGDPPESLGVTRRPRHISHDEVRVQFEDLKDKYRLLRHQYQIMQAERDKALEEARLAQENSKSVWRKNEEMKRERTELQKKLQEQKSFAQRGQVTRFDHEALAKRYDHACAQLRHQQHDKEQLTQRFQQDKQELDSHYLEELRSLKASLEEGEQDRDTLRYKLSEYKRENDRLNEQLSCLGPSQERSKREVGKIMEQRDTLRQKFAELKQEYQLLQERSRSMEALAQDVPQDQRLAGLQRELADLREEKRCLTREQDELREGSAQLKRSLEAAEGRGRELDTECQRLRGAVSSSELRPQSGRSSLSHGNSSEDMLQRRQPVRTHHRGRGSQGSTDEDFAMTTSDSENLSSVSDLAQLTRSDVQLSADLSEGGSGGGGRGGGVGLSYEAKKTLSSSTSNLVAEVSEHTPSHSRLSELNSRLRGKLSRLEKALEEAKKEREGVTSQKARVSQEKGEIEVQLQTLLSESEQTKQALAAALAKCKDAEMQVGMMAKEKGVAMRDNAASYQQSLQRETELRELQAERDILKEQRDIANKMREKVSTELFAAKRKLETIKTQRQKDAKDLSAMRHLKDKAQQELAELRKTTDHMERSKVSVEAELGKVQECVHRAAMKLSPTPRSKTAGVGGAHKTSSSNSSLAQDLSSLVDRLSSAEYDRKMIVRKLFCSELDTAHSLNDVLQKLEAILQDRDSMVLEIEALQKTSSKLSEERIFELKQRIEDLLMERDSICSQNKGLKREVTSLSTKLMKVDQEKERWCAECDRLKLQCQHLSNTRSRLVEDHSKTLERFNELWKQKWPHVWDEAWEEKNVSVPLDSDGFAGFSVVGGRDQPQLPNPAAFIITTVISGGPADGMLKIGDILESVNGVPLTNADHREAVRAVKESKGALNMVLRRRRNAYPIEMGIVSAVNSVPHVLPAESAKPEEHEYSLYITGKENLGFRYEWMAVCTVTDVAASGPATRILEKGDRIVKVNNAAVSHEKPSNIKKLMKPHKNILRLVIERPSRGGQERATHTGQAPPPPAAEWPADFKVPPFSASPPVHPKLGHRTRSHSHSGDSSAPSHPKKSYHSDDDHTQQSQDSTYSELKEGVASGGARKGLLRYNKRSSDSYSSSRDSFSQGTASQDSSSRPTKLVSVVTCVKGEGQQQAAPIVQPRPTSDGAMYANYNERRIEYEEVLLSEQTDSQYSQSESFVTESSYDDLSRYEGLSSQSIDLTFHTVSTMPSHNRLTVDTVMTTQNDPAHSQQSEEEGFFARDDASRTTFRTRTSGENLSNVNSNGNNSEFSDSLSESQLTDSGQLTDSYTDGSNSQEYQQRPKSHGGIKSKLKFRKRKSNSVHGKLSSSDQNLARAASNLVLRGRSRSNLSLGHAPSMTSVIEEPRRSTSTTNLHVSDLQAHDPLADATYIRANFTYIPRNPKEISMKAGDVFHIHDEAPPMRFRAAFWVSRLSADGTDEQVGAIPNSTRAQEYLAAQGESLDIPMYEEVEAFTGTRPVLVFGALADQVVSSLLESCPGLFHSCPTETVEIASTARITEVRLRREVEGGNLVDFRPVDDNTFEVIKVDAVNVGKSKHCLLTGSIQALQSLKSIAPPITILVRAMTEESITTFSPEPLSQGQAKEIFDEVSLLEDRHGHEFSASLFLIYMDTLMGQIEDIVKKDKRKQAWVPVARET